MRLLYVTECPTKPKTKVTGNIQTTFIKGGVSLDIFLNFANGMEARKTLKKVYCKSVFFLGDFPDSFPLFLPWKQD